MPFTPFHLGPGAVAHAVAPRHVSFLAFCAGNVLIDVEPLYYMVTGQDPLHRFMHTYIGATLAVAATVALFMAALRLSKLVRLPDVFGWQSLKWPPVLVGSATGCTCWCPSTGCMTCAWPLASWACWPWACGGGGGRALGRTRLAHLGGPPTRWIERP